ncbi:hypothetical protein AAA450_10235 [Staphylococcus equorum]|uniref:hypothetical protein n=1 Tax=Staphylococcus equorum TaxID=246432 RepID=UPI003D800925
MYEREQIKNMLEDYKAMCNTLEQLVPDLDSNSIAQYGIEAALPKPQGTNSSKVETNVITREKRTKGNERLINKIEFINKHQEDVLDDRNYCLLTLLKLGKGTNEIINIMAIKRDEYFTRKKMLVEELYKLQFID